MSYFEAKMLLIRFQLGTAPQTPSCILGVLLLRKGKARVGEGKGKKRKKEGEREERRKEEMGWRGVGGKGKEREGRKEGEGFSAIPRPAEV